MLQAQGAGEEVVAAGAVAGAEAGEPQDRAGLALRDELLTVSVYIF